MQEFDHYLNILKTPDNVDDADLVEISNQLIKIISQTPSVSQRLIDSLLVIYNNEIDIIQVRAIEIALKLLDYSIRSQLNNYAKQILEFLHHVIPNSIEKVQSTLIIHYSWAHRKYPFSSEIISIYNEMIDKFNEEKSFHNLFNEINHMDGGGPP